MSNISKPSYPLVIVYCIPMLATIIITLTLYSNLNDFWPLVGIFGTLISLRFFSVAIIMLRNISYLNKKDLLAKMQNENPQKTTKHFGMSDNFIFSYQHHIALPIEYVAKINITKKQYVNSLKGFSALDIMMQDGKTFTFLHYGELTRKSLVNSLEQIAYSIENKIRAKQQSH